jgi:hypothetical protein
MHRNAVLCRHVEEHARKPVVGERSHQVRDHAELGAAERRRNRVAAEAHRVVARDRLVVAVRNGVDQKRDVDVALADEECVHVGFRRVILGRNGNAVTIRERSALLFYLFWRQKNISP